MDFIAHPFDDIVTIIITLSVLVGAIAYVWQMLRNGKNKANQETIEGYKGELTIIKEQQERIRNENDEIRKENRGLTAQVNQLIGENKTLKEVLALRDPKFEEKFMQLLRCVEGLQKDFNNHTKNDEKDFREIKELIKESK